MAEGVDMAEVMEEEAMEEEAMEDMAEVMEDGTEVMGVTEVGMAVMAVTDITAGMDTTAGIMIIIMAAIMGIMDLVTMVIGAMGDMILISMVLPTIMIALPIHIIRLLRRQSISMTIILIPMITAMADMIILLICKRAVEMPYGGAPVNPGMGPGQAQNAGQAMMNQGQTPGGGMIVMKIS